MSKRCSKCEEIKDESLFSKNPSKKDGLHNHCKSCRSSYQTSQKTRDLKKLQYSQNPDYFKDIQKRYVSRHKEQVSSRRKLSYRKNINKVLFRLARGRAKKLNLPFNIEISDISVPPNCPVLGTPIMVSNGYAGDNSPSVDRIIPSRGYVKGNIIVISNKANSIKNNGTVEEITKVANFFRKFLV